MARVGEDAGVPDDEPSAAAPVLVEEAVPPRPDAMQRDTKMGTAGGRVRRGKVFRQVVLDALEADNIARDVCVFLVRGPHLRGQKGMPGSGRVLGEGGIEAVGLIEVGGAGGRPGGVSRGGSQVRARACRPG